MAKKKNDGAAVRQAMDGPKVEYDDLMSTHQKWATAEGDAASDAGERRQQIGAFAEKHGINNKALSQFRAGMKLKKEEQRRDWVRSLRHLVEHAEAAIFGNTPDMLDEADKKAEAKPEPDQKAEDETGDQTDEDTIVPFGETTAAE